MGKDTFFDLQRFDEVLSTTALGATNAATEDTLVGTAEGIIWKGGHSFAGAGTAEDPAQMSTAGASVIASTQIYLNGTRDGYTFSVSQNASDWNVNVKGSDNVIAGAFSQDGSTYGLNGEVTVNVTAGKAFDETVNGEAAYIKASKNADVSATVTADGFSDGGLEYTFNNASSVAIGVDSNDTAVFNGTSTDITLGAAANANTATIGGFAFGGNATVTSNGTNLVAAVKGGTDVTVGEDTWEFTNKSTRQDAALLVDANGDVRAVSATRSAYVRNDIDTALTVNINGNATEWNQITGDVGSVSFDKDGAYVRNIEVVTDANGTAQIAPINEGAVTVAGNGANATVGALTTAGVTANGVKIQAVADSIDAFSVDLSEGGTGIDGISFEYETDAVKVTGDQSFEVKAQNSSYSVATSADNITFEVVGEETSPADEGYIETTVVSGQSYSVTGGNALYNLNDVAIKGKAAVSINGAGVTINNNGSAMDNYVVGSEDGKNGIVGVLGLKAGDAINVTGDNDGYTAYFEAPSDDAGDVVFEANGAKFTVNAAYIDDDGVKFFYDGDKDVTVQGIEGGATISVASGDVVYHFKNSLARNEVTVASGNAFTEVTLTGSGDVATVPTAGIVENVIDDADQPRVNADQSKWNEISAAGGDTDTVVGHHASVYSDFYNLTESGVANQTLAGYTEANDTAPGSVSANIDLIGNAPLGEAAHITLTGGTEVGNVPINIQKNENDNAVDVTVNLTNGSQPSTVAVGTSGNVSASHDIRLSNAGTATNPSTAYLGAGATGENVLTGGSGYNMLRHDGSNRASIVGGTGIDTIRGAVNDIVSGGTGGDYFYDLSGYALDYNVAEGDVIIASRLASLDEVTADNIIRGAGNQVGFGNGSYLLTLGNIDPNSAVFMKVGVMDNDGNIVNGTRDVALANGNGIVDAASNNLNDALIVANSTRGDGVHQVVGSEGNDTIYVGAYDAVSGSTGNDKIVIDSNAPGVTVFMSAGNDSVEGWNYGFDRAAGNTQLNAGGAQVRGRVYEDRLLISLEGGNSVMSFEETKQLGMHGQYDVLIDGKKYTAIRSGDAGMGYASVTSNDEVADYYLAEREGVIYFESGVTDLIGVDGLVDLNSENFQYIRQLALYNNSKAFVVGSSDRESVSLGGDATAGATKAVSLGGGNDVIISGGDDNTKASQALFFGAGDGRDSVVNFNHYNSVNEDPDYQSSDLIVLQSLAGVKSEYNADENAVRVEFAINDSGDYAVVYESVTAYNYDTNMYRVSIADSGSEGLAKIGYSTTDNPTGLPNTFTYDKETSFYVGASGQAVDTLVINEQGENVQIYLDGSQDVNGDGTKEFYRGIGVVNASTATNTNLTIAGSADNNILMGGGEGTRSFLWGNGGSNTLVGGAGADYFIYCKDTNAWASGGADQSGTNDLITGYDCNSDYIVLNGVSLDDINYAAMAQAGGDSERNYGITENAVTVSFKNGGSVQVGVTDQEKVSFYLGDGNGGVALISAERSTGEWKREA